MILTPTKLTGLSTTTPDVVCDSRGFFIVANEKANLRSKGVAQEFSQVNHSGSYQCVLRGPNYQIQLAQGKLVQALVGEGFEMSVDLRRSSETFGQ